MNNPFQGAWCECIHGIFLLNSNNNSASSYYFIDVCSCLYSIFYSKEFISECNL